MFIIKKRLEKVVGIAKLNFQELNTFIAEMKKCIDSRPLTDLAEEHENTAITLPKSCHLLSRYWQKLHSSTRI